MFAGLAEGVEDNGRIVDLVLHAADKREKEKMMGNEKRNATNKKMKKKMINCFPFNISLLNDETERMKRKFHPRLTGVLSAAAASCSCNHPAATHSAQSVPHTHCRKERERKKRKNR